MNFKEFLQSNCVVLDGAMGTELQFRGLNPGELTETWSISHAEKVIEVHKAYFDAGSNVVYANTFGANIFKYSKEKLQNIIPAALQAAKRAAELSRGDQEKYVALDIGPLGKLLKPYGDLDFEDAVRAFKYSVEAGVKENPDLVVIETMNDSYETKAALLAVKETCNLPVIVSNTYGEDGRLMTGATVQTMVQLLEGMEADAIGVNCGLGPKQLLQTVKEYVRLASVPVICKPNAGMPKLVQGKTTFDISPDEFAQEMHSIAKCGARVLGGCCGTNPEYIKAIISSCQDVVVSKEQDEEKPTRRPVIIGERINPTGKKRLQQALLDKDISFLLKEATGQEDAGSDWLDVNVGLPEIKEEKMLPEVVAEIQAVTNLPLVIDTSDPKALEKALRIYNGVAIVNSVNGKKESIQAVFPLVKKYGGMVIALTLDEMGIPETAKARFEIAKRIVNIAREYGIEKDRLIFDPLAMTVSASPHAGTICLDAISLINNKLGCKTLLGVSNISFGLPARELVNRTFLAMALDRGLYAAIINPYSFDMMETIHAFNALRGLDRGCARYIDYAQRVNKSENVHSANILPAKSEQKDVGLYEAISKGLKETAIHLTKAELSKKNPLDILRDIVIPALNEVGRNFEEKRLFLPQLLMSAEAAGNAFDVIKAAHPEKKTNNVSNTKIILATVKGDVHDIGKSIVKMLLENYGFKVIDLGKDVEPEVILDEIKLHHADICGLSALMTTTLPSMEESIKLIKEKADFCKVLVGGAVLTKGYAKSIGADYYCKTAMDTVNYVKDYSKKSS